MECQKILWKRFGMELKYLRVTVWNQFWVKFLCVMQWNYVQLLKMSWHWHISTISTSTHRCYQSILTQHDQRQKQQHNEKLSGCLQCTGGASRVFSQQLKPYGPYSKPLLCEQDSKFGMSNEFGEIQREDWVTYRITMLNCRDVSVIDHSSWRVVLVGLHTWDLNRRKSWQIWHHTEAIDRYVLVTRCRFLNAWLIQTI